MTRCPCWRFMIPGVADQPCEVCAMCEEDLRMLELKKQKSVLGTSD